MLAIDQVQPAGDDDAGASKHSQARHGVPQDPVEGAARTYFQKPAADLGPAESALLAAAIVNPRLLNPARPTARLIRRQQLILRRMGAVIPPQESAQLER